MLCLSLTSFALFAQIEFETSVEYNKETADGEITVVVTSANPDYIYSLTTHDPLKGKVIQKSNKTRKNRYTFKGIKAGTYFVKVEDGSGLYALKSVRIDDLNVIQ